MRPEIDPPLFREIMASFPAGVVVVTANGAGGRPRGLTVNAFCPVSLRPPLVLICVDRASNTLPAIQESGGFTVNILATGRQRLAAAMATKSEAKFDSVSWSPPQIPEAGPVLGDDIAAHAECTVERAVEAGDHWVFFGLVRAGAAVPDRIPLVYHRQAFFELGSG